MKKKLTLFLFCLIAAGPLSSQIILTPSQERGAIKLIAAYESQLEIIDSLTARNTDCLLIVDQMDRVITQVRETVTACELVTDNLRHRVVKLQDDLEAADRKLKRNRIFFGAGGIIIGSIPFILLFL